MSETLRWTKERVRFTDHSRGFKTDGPGEYDVPADVAERYLSHRSDGWERVTESGSTEEQNADDSVSEETTDGYTRAELEAMDWSELRQMAVESDREDINGRSSKADIIEALAND